MTIEIIGVPFSNFVRTVRMVAHEKGVEYKLVNAMPRSEEVRAINPFAQIPVMRDGDLQISESMAIARYLNTFAGPQLIPSDPKAAAVVDQWVCRTAIPVDQLLIRRYAVPYLFHRNEDGSVNRTEIDKAIKRFPEVFSMLDVAVARGFLGGNEFTMADCFFIPIVLGVLNFPEAKEAIATFSNLKTYCERMALRESYVASAN